MKAARERLQALSRSARCAQAGAEKTCIQLADVEAVLESSEEEILHAATVLKSLVPKGPPPWSDPSPLNLGYGSPFREAQFSCL